MSSLLKQDVGSSNHKGTATYDVFVGGLPDTATDRQVNTRYKDFGEIHSIALIKGKYPGTKVAFVRYFSKLDAEKAVQETNGEIFEGKFLMVRRTQVREQSSEENNNRLLPGKGNWNMNKENQRRTVIGTNGSTAVAQGGISQVEERQVFVTQVEDVCTFWGQNMKVGEKIVQFSAELQGVCAQGRTLTTPPQPSQLYGAKFSEDQQWYRCRVINMVSDDQALVQYVDYGNRETVQWREIRQLPMDFASLPPYAESYRLSGMVPTGQEQAQGIAHLRSLIEYQAVQVKVRATPEDGPIEAEVMVEGVKVSQSMMEKGFIGQRPVKQPPAKPTPETVDRVMAKGDTRDREALDQLQTMKAKIGDMEGRIKVFVQERHSLQDQINKQHKLLQLQVQEIQEKEKRLEKVQIQLQERDTKQHKLLQLQVQEIQEKEKELEEAQTQLQERAAALIQLRTDICEKDRLIENSLSHQVQVVSAQVKKVQISRKEMPVEQDVPDPIQQAITMVTDKTQRIGPADIQTVVKVSEALGKLKGLQEQISACSQKDETLTTLISARNDVRCDAHTAITECIQEMQSLPLHSRLSSLQDTVANIEQTYQKYVTNEVKFVGKASTETFQSFMEWRTQKVQNLQSLRRATNQHCKEVCQELQAVVQFLSSLLTGETGNDVETGAAGSDLAELLSDFGQVMQQELADSQVEEGADLKLMTAVVNMLLNDLRGEMADIHKLQDLLARNVKCRDDMTRWLSSQPDLDPLRQVKKEIRALKSEIRHKMADKQDLEEEGVTGAQLQQVELHLMDLREKIQVAFSREHQLLGEAAAHTGSHFPELPLLYPELNLGTFMESDGLVKVGWELDHYNMSPVPLALTKGTAPYSAAILTTFNHKPVVIKEYMIEGGEGWERAKKTILGRAKEFHGFKHPSLIAVEAVFFSKTMRQMYVQMPYYLGSSLIELQDSNPLNNLETFLVLKGVLEGLYHLHSRGVCHGAVTPQYVLAPGRTEGILDNYDFAKTATQRAATPYQTPNGLSFVPPEVGRGEPASAASDMYQFGVLVLWLCHPADSFSCTETGVPSLRDISLAVEHREFLPRLLQANSSTRPSAETLLQLKFFKEPPAKLPPPIEPKSPALLSCLVQDLGSSHVAEEVESTHHDMAATNQTDQPSPTVAASKAVPSLVTSLPTASEAPTTSRDLPQPLSPVLKSRPTALIRPASPLLASSLSSERSPQVSPVSDTAAVIKETDVQAGPNSPSSKEVANSNAETEKVPGLLLASQEILKQQHLDILKAKGANVLIQYGVSSPDVTDSEPVSNLPADSDTTETSPDTAVPPSTPPTARRLTSVLTSSMRASMEAAYQSLGLLMSPTKHSSNSSQLSTTSGGNGSVSCLEESPATESTDLEASMAATSSPASLSPPPSPLRTTPEMVEQQSFFKTSPEIVEQQFSLKTSPEKLSPLRVGLGSLSSQLKGSLPSSYYSPNGDMSATVTDTGLDGPDQCETTEEQ